jgi:nucleoside permease NupC
MKSRRYIIFASTIRLYEKLFDTLFQIAWLMEISCGTSGPETVSCVGNIFVGMTESPLLVRPYLKNLTQSELFCIMVSGMASLAGSVLGAYIKMGISSVDLVTASVLSAPGSIAIAKLMFPEVQQTRFKVLYLSPTLRTLFQNDPFKNMSVIRYH